MTDSFAQSPDCSVKGSNREPQLPDDQGRFGIYGGRFVSETLTAALDELCDAWQKFLSDSQAQQELSDCLSNYAGRPTPLYFASRLSDNLGYRVYLKREDLTHTGAHKINNALGQVLLACRMKKTRVIAETGAGQHGVATATAAALFGLRCRIYMGAEDMRRQRLNVYRIRLLGAEVHSVESGSRTLKDAMNDALRDWVTNVDDTHYVIGSAAGPHPYPMMVRDLQRVIGEETREQILLQTGRLPDALVACVGGGSNALGFFHPFLADTSVRLVGVEAAGQGLATGQHAAPLNAGRVGVLHGNRTYLMADEAGQIQPTASIAAGLDYPGVGPEHAWLKDSGRAEYVGATDQEALDALRKLSLLEGIIPALETSHALAWLEHLSKDYRGENTVIVNLSGRGDKDMVTLAETEQ